MRIVIGGNLKAGTITEQKCKTKKKMEINEKYWDNEKEQEKKEK